MVFELLALFVVTFLLQEALRPKPRFENARAAGLGDFDFPTASEARSQSLIFGRVLVRGINVSWFGNLVPVPITKRIARNLWSGSRQTLGFKYYVGVAATVGRGPVTAYRRFFIGEQEVWSGNITTDGGIASIDKPALFGGDASGGGGVQMDVVCYLGTQTQNADPYLTRFQADSIGPGNVQPHWRGEAYFVARALGTGATAPPATVEGWPGGAYVGNSERVQPWAVEVEAFPPSIPGQPAGAGKIGTTEANPANALFQILTDPEALGEPVADIDLASFIAASNTLAAESNGLALEWGGGEASELIQEIERQIDGITYLDPTTGKWVLKLVRADYVLASTPHLTDSNVIAVEDYASGTWADTVNQLKVVFYNRGDFYKESTAIDQDPANMLMQGGGNFSTVRVVPAVVKFPGVKTAANAQNLVGRELRARSRPLVKATVKVTRELFTSALLPGNVVRLSNTRLGLVELAMRIRKTDMGSPRSNAITLSLVEDVFRTEGAGFGVPPATGWTYPALVPGAIAAGAQLIQEAPRAVVVRDPDYSDNPDLVASRLLVAVSTGAVAATLVQIGQRFAAGAPSGAFTDAGDLTGFALAGTLAATLPVGASPVGSVVITPTAGTQADVLALLPAAAPLSLTQLGAELAGLVQIGTGAAAEFVLVRSAVASGPVNVALQNVYRGMLDTAQKTHTAGTPVWLLCAGAAVTTAPVPTANNVQVELRGDNGIGTVYAGATSVAAFATTSRALRPYPPSVLTLAGVGWAPAPSLESSAGTLATIGVALGVVRRRYTATDEVAEAAGATPDASTEYRYTVHADPTGANLQVFVSAWLSGAVAEVLPRAAALLGGPVGTVLRVTVDTRHVVDGVTYNGDALKFDTTPTSALSGALFFGASLGPVAPSALYTAGAGVHTLELSAATTVAIQASINGGAYATIITAGATTGTTAALTAGDTIRIRRASGAISGVYVELRSPAPAVVAYGSFA